MRSLKQIDGAKLKEYRRAAGMTQAALGKASGVDKNTICTYETGRRNPSLESIMKLCNALGITPDQLYKEGTLPEAPDESPVNLPVSEETCLQAFGMDITDYTAMRDILAAFGYRLSVSDSTFPVETQEQRDRCTYTASEKRISPDGSMCSVTIGHLVMVNISRVVTHIGHALRDRDYIIESHDLAPEQFIELARAIGTSISYQLYKFRHENKTGGGEPL